MSSAAALENTMTLPFDIARCTGTTHPTCQWCRRKEPGRDGWQTYIVPPIDTLVGQCESLIETPRAYTSNHTQPNQKVIGGTSDAP